MTIKKKQWRCPQCNCTNPPKSYTCPICKTQFDANYNVLEIRHPSMNMDDEDFEGRKD